MWGTTVIEIYSIAVYIYLEGLEALDIVTRC